MSTTAWRFRTTEGADDAILKLKQLQAQDLIDLQDVAVVRWPQHAHGPSAQQHVTDEGNMVSGIVSKLRGAGRIDTGMLDSVKTAMVPGTSAVVMMSYGAVVDVVARAFEGDPMEADPVGSAGAGAGSAAGAVRRSEPARGFGLSDLADAGQLAAMLDSHITTQVIACAVRFGIPDLLAHDSAEDQLSAATGISLGRLRRFLGVLQYLGLVEAVGGGTYRNTPMARHLRKDTGALAGHALMAGKVYYEAWENLDFSLLTGRSAFERQHGDSLWTHLDDDPEAAAAFTRTQRWNTERFLGEIVELYPFPESGVIADLGAGDGNMTAALLQRLPGLRAIVLEQPAVIGSTRSSLEEQGVGHRVTFVTGSFLEQVPPGGDLYLLKSVVHNWDDPSALRILRNCRAAMTAGARLLLIEHTTDEAHQAQSALADLMMLVLFGSSDRTAADYCRLVQSCGFAVSQTWRGSSGLCLLEAAPA